MVQPAAGPGHRLRVADIVARTKTGYSTSRANYLAQLVSKRVTGRPGDGYINAPMQWGIDHEAEARRAYAFRYDLGVELAGSPRKPNAPRCVGPKASAKPRAPPTIFRRGVRCNSSLAHGVEYDHYPIRAGDGGSAELAKCSAVCVKCHQWKTAKIDNPQIAKSKRLRDKLHDIVDRSDPIPGSRNSLFKRRLNGSTERRD